MSEAALVESCRRIGLEPDPVKFCKLLILKDFLVFYGRSMNLHGQRELDAQFIEALQVVALAERLEIRGRWLDIGSGGGFPGLILAAWLDELELVFVEPRAKRAGFLELALAKLGRPDVTVLRGRIDRGRWKPVENGLLEPGFDVASARAVFSPERWIEEARPWVVDGGLVCLHLRAGEAAPSGSQVVDRVDGDHWAAVAIRNVSRETPAG